MFPTTHWIDQVYGFARGTCRGPDYPRAYLTYLLAGCWAACKHNAGRLSKTGKALQIDFEFANKSQQIDGGISPPDTQVGKI